MCHTGMLPTILENQGLLDPVNERDLYALHYTFLPRINRALLKFQEGWNCHGISNMSPNQLFTYGALQLQHTGLAALDFFEQVSHDYRIDDDAPTPLDVGNEVSVPRNAIHLESEQLELLRREVDPLGESDNYGVEIYTKVIEMLNRYL